MPHVREGPREEMIGGAGTNVECGALASSRPCASSTTFATMYTLIAPCAALVGAAAA